MKCVHCKKEIGEVDLDHDEYDLYSAHLSNCTSKLANEIMNAKDSEQFGFINRRN